MKQYLYQIATDQKQGVLASLIKGVCLFLSWVYGFAVWGIRFLYKVRILQKHSLPKPVISVGNITLGGVGKTPFVQLLARALQEKKVRPAVLIRGYMNKPGASDEAVMLQESLEEVQIAVGRDRVKAAENTFGRNLVDAFILDDGFQHWRLERDLDIVLIDAGNPFGNSRLIPRGILRESPASLRRAGMFVLTKTDAKSAETETLKKVLKEINPECPVIETVHKPVSFRDVRNNNSRMDVSSLCGKTICAFCGIGDPKSFEDSLSKTNVVIGKNFYFMDHHLYTKEDIDGIIQYCRSKEIFTAVTTQKDAVKIMPFLYRFGKDMQLFSLEITVEIVKGRNEFFQRIHRILPR